MKFIIFALLAPVATIFSLPAESINNISVEDVGKPKYQIAGGQSAEPGQFPYQVGLKMHQVIPGLGRINWWCGGALIASNVILTAANCVNKAETVEAFFGVTNLEKDESTRQVLTLTKDQIIIHHQYEGARARNDIALIKLQQNLKLNKYIQTVNLPRRSQQNENFESSVGWITGWGMFGQFTKFAEVLQYATRRILPSNMCENHFTVFLKETQICVDGSNKISICSGDIGGPLVVVENDGSRTLVGITSYGSPNGCVSGNPSVSSRVSAFLDWIAKHGDIHIRD